MIPDLTIWRWHRRIIKDAEKTLGRPLKDYEKTFITSRGGCIALEMIHDTIKAADKAELEEYLASERRLN
jgi:microsomal dipeptidase-like Zn-dependent dipeptidase